MPIAAGAGGHGGLGWYGVAVSAALLAVGVAAGVSSLVQGALAVAGLLLLLAGQDRLVLAPVYGGGLLLAGELAERSIELAGDALVAAGALAARAGAAVAIAGAGAGCAAVVGLAVTLAPARSPAFTAVGAAAALGAAAAVVVLVRRRAGVSGAGPPAAPGHRAGSP